jgi:hypothetical protein
MFRVSLAIPGRPLGVGPAHIPTRLTASSAQSRGASRRWRTSVGCSWNRAGPEPTYAILPRRSYRLTGREGDGQARIEGPHVTVAPDVAQAIAVTFHELATNAAKYGALSVPKGSVQVEWSREEDGRVVLRWTEANGPAVKPPTYQGFGTRVMESIITGQLKSQIRFAWRAQGLACEITVPA